MSTIERIAQNKIGFYCGHLFLMDQWRSYEVRFHKNKSTSSLN